MKTEAKAAYLLMGTYDPIAEEEYGIMPTDKLRDTEDRLWEALSRETACVVRYYRYSRSGMSREARLAFVREALSRCSTQDIR